MKRVDWGIECTKYCIALLANFLKICASDGNGMVITDWTDFGGSEAHRVGGPDSMAAYLIFGLKHWKTP